MPQFTETGSHWYLTVRNNGARYLVHQVHRRCLEATTISEKQYRIFEGIADKLVEEEQEWKAGGYDGEDFESDTAFQLDRLARSFGLNRGSGKQLLELDAENLLREVKPIPVEVYSYPGDSEDE